MRLGFHYHVPVYRDPQGRLRTPGHQGRFLDSLAAECEQLVCFLHSARPDEVPYMDYVLTASNLVWVGLGPHASVPSRLLASREIIRIVSPWLHRLDALLLRGPSPLLPWMGRAAFRLPVALLLVGDHLPGIDDLPQPRWRKGLIRLWHRWNHRGQLLVARKALTLVNSRKLYDNLKPHATELQETRTTNLTRWDFHNRTDTCQQRPIRLLYTGRIDRAKGLLVIVEALAQLVQGGEDVVLDLVGPREKADNALEEVYHLAREQGISSRVTYHGYRSLGPELFRFYRRADLYVLASLENESFPRGIWEAMAHSLPTVATRVGSIPLLLRDRESARLVNPRDSRALAAGVADLIHNPTLRQRIIQSGQALARESTLEVTTKDLIERLRAWILRERLRPSMSHGATYPAASEASPATRITTSSYTA